MGVSTKNGGGTSPAKAGTGRACTTELFSHAGVAFCCRGEQEVEGYYAKEGQMVRDPF